MAFDIEGAKAAGYTDEEIQAHLAAKQQPTDAPHREWTDVLTSAIGNIPESGKAQLTGIWDAVTSPVETGKAIGNVALGTVEKAIPGEQDSEKYADSIGQMMYGRYGGMENFKKTLAEDPVGVVLDASLLLTGVGGGMKAAGTYAPKIARAGEAVAKAGQMLDPVSAVAKAVPAALPEKLYQSAAKMSTGAKFTPAQRTEATRAALDNGIMPTQAGRETLLGKVQTLSKQVDDIINSQPAGAAISRDTLLSDLDDLRANVGNMVDPQGYMKAIDAFEDRVRSGKFAKPDQLSPREVQDLKVATYRELEKYYAPNRQGVTNTQMALVEAKKNVPRQAMKALEDLDPRIGQLNAEQRKLLGLNDAIENSIKRIENRDLIGLGTPAKAITGEVLGQAAGVPGVGGVAGIALGILDDPKIKARLAIALDAFRRSGGTVGGVPVTGAAANIINLRESQQIQQ